MDKLEDIFNSIKHFFEEFGYFFTVTLFKLGSSSISLLTIFYIVFAIGLLIYLSKKFSKLFAKTVLSRYSGNIATIQSIATISRYIILVVGTMVIIQTAGIDLSALSILAGALGVGIGFGLQNITNNFISGIIILFEQPIKVGDRIEVGDIKGNVTKISARSTNIITNDNISVIVPNSEFISSTVINWSHNDRNISFRYPVSVSYKEDPKLIKRLLLEIASENNGVLSKPAPDVLFDEFGDSSLNFLLRVWTTDYIDRPNVLKSQLYFAIFKKFRENKIEIPFPQRDLNLRNGFDKLHEYKKDEI